MKEKNKKSLFGLNKEIQLETNSYHDKENPHL